MHRSSSSTDYALELRITVASIGLTLLAWVMFSRETVDILVRRIQAHDLGGSLEQALFIVIVQLLVWGNFLYQLARLGYLRRRGAHRSLSWEEREVLYEGEAPSLAILVPSYKEELAVVRRTLVSAALQDYPRRRVVLLLDDPPQPADLSAHAALEALRRLPAELQASLNRAAAPLERAEEAFVRRAAAGKIVPRREAFVLAHLYRQAASSVESMAASAKPADHAEQLFLQCVIGRAALAHRQRAESLLEMAGAGALTRARLEREYRRLARLFRVGIASFERKRYVNLSHEPNKAMNLNSYIGLLGGRWREARRGDGLHLEPAPPGRETLNVPAADFLVTLDADSVLVPEYALVLINEMLRPGNERLAVAQTPYNAIPHPPGRLERIASATTDIQYLIHQGFTHFDATYWVGANALLRVAALEDIRQTVRERGYEVGVFIQDRTVIEDTESSVDLVARGWKLFNYPERLAFSATPPDFGALLIQRRRWANGGLLILPKLLRHLRGRSGFRRSLVEAFFRVHYLGSIAAVNFGLLLLLGHSFDRSIHGLWLPLSALPYFVLYARDLRYSGYRASDLARVYALNLLLIPVNIGGVLGSLRQAATGRRIPFGRTPKISDRTATPRLYVLAEYALLASWLIGFGRDIAAGRWVSGAFCLANAGMLAYAIAAFMGLRESWADLRGAQSAPIRPALPAAVSPRPSGNAAALIAPLAGEAQAALPARRVRRRR